MTASASDIHVVSQTIRKVLDEKSKKAWVDLSKYVSDEELAAISKFAIDTLDWHRASEEPKMPRVAVVKKET